MTDGGSLNLNGGGIVNAGAVSGVTNLTMSGACVAWRDAMRWG